MKTDEDLLTADALKTLNEISVLNESGSPSNLQNNLNEVMNHIGMAIGEQERPGALDLYDMTMKDFIARRLLEKEGDRDVMTPKAYTQAIRTKFALNDIVRSSNLQKPDDAPIDVAGHPLTIGQFKEIVTRAQGLLSDEHRSGVFCHQVCAQTLDAIEQWQKKAPKAKAGRGFDDPIPEAFLQELQQMRHEDVEGVLSNLFTAGHNSAVNLLRYAEGKQRNPELIGNEPAEVLDEKWLAPKHNGHMQLMREEALHSIQTIVPVLIAGGSGKTTIGEFKQAMVEARELLSTSAPLGAFTRQVMAEEMAAVEKWQGLPEREKAPASSREMLRSDRPSPRDSGAGKNSTGFTDPGRWAR